MRPEAAAGRSSQAPATSLLAAFGVVLASCALSHADSHDAASEFDTATVRFEQNATDRDVEVVFEVKGGDDGLTRLTITGPDGRTVLEVNAPDASTLGMREFAFESPEPKDVAALKAAYPEGAYRFSGGTASGQQFRGEATLGHALPATVEFVSPAEDAEGVSATDLVIAWKPAGGVAGYVVEIENDDLEVGLNATLPADASKLPVPAGFLAPGTEYELGIGTVAESGNISFVETSFTTAE